MSQPTAAYIQLCREAKLPRQLQAGDWLAIHNPALSTRKTAFYLESGGRFGSAPAKLEDPERELFWLPREGDLLDLIWPEIDPIATGTGFIHVTRLGGDRAAASAGMLTDSFPDRWYEEAADVCTALLRLLQAVLGR